MKLSELKHDLELKYRLNKTIALAPAKKQSIAKHIKLQDLK